MSYPTTGSNTHVNFNQETVYAVHKAAIWLVWGGGRYLTCRWNVSAFSSFQIYLMMGEDFEGMVCELIIFLPVTSPWSFFIVKTNYSIMFV